MVQSETGLSEVHFEAASTNSHQKETKEEVIRSTNNIKELGQLATVSTTSEVNSQKCQHRNCKGGFQSSSEEGLFSAEVLFLKPNILPFMSNILIEPISRLLNKY